MTAETHVRAVAYEVTALPSDVQDHSDAGYFAIRVEWRGGGKWAVKHHSSCLNKSGGWVYEPQPSSRTKRFLRAYRHDLDTALALAQNAAPKVTLNRFTVDEFTAWVRNQRASEPS